MDHGVESPLQKCRIDRAERLVPLGRHARREDHCMLLRDADIEIAVGMVRPEQVQRGAVGHRRRNGNHLVIPVGQL